MEVINAFLDILFPAHCISCARSGAFLCTQCLAHFPAPERDSAEWVYPLYDYRYPMVKKSIWFLKYKNKKGLAKIFAEALLGRMLEELAELEIMENFTQPILVPIPLSNQRHRERGFNQSALICKWLSKLDKGNFIFENNLLIRTKDNEHQARIENRKDRLKNILGSFEAKNIEKIRRRNIILIDDVTTTGATLSEARKTLKAAGAKKVIAFTVAH